MEVEKRGLKGGFRNLFDWTGKSRKKLFLNNSELPEESKQGKENVDNLAISRLRLIEVDGNGASSSNKESSEYKCASSVTSDEGYGARAPGVVARLMGLDSLPTSNVSEPCSIPFTVARSLRDTFYDGSNTNFQGEQHIINFGNMCNRIEGISRNPVRSTPQKIQNRPIERFQTEILPPKSTKSIPITHHKLWSPIKGPGFTPTKNAAHIMEAAAKIIEPGPQTTIKYKIPSFRSSSVPLRIRDLKQKMEAAQKVSRPQRPKEINAVNRMRGQSHNKNKSICNGLEDTTPFKASIDSEKGSSDSLKNKGKSVSLAIQAKANVQRREGLASSSNRSSTSQKEHNEVKSNQFFKSQPNIPRNGRKRTSTNRTPIVLRQNNQKQNCASTKDKLTSKPSVSNLQARKPLSMNGSFGPNKTINKVILNSESGSRKIGPVATSEKELSSSKGKNYSRKKRPISEDIPFEERVSDNVLFNKDGRSVQCNAALDGCMSWGADTMNRSMDVVSFTFTSPIKGSMPGSQSSDQAMENNDSFGVYSHGQNDSSDSKISKLSSLGLSVIGGDALSVLLDQKLRELTSRIESSQYDLVEIGPAASSASSLQDSVSNFNALSATSMEHDGNIQVAIPKDKLDGLDDFDCSSVDELLLNANQKCQGFEGVEDHSSHSDNSEAGKELDCQHSAQDGSLEPSFSDGSCFSSDSRNSCTNGSKQCSLAQPHEVINSISTKELQPVEGETELSNLASSTSTGDMVGKHVTATSSLTDFMRSADWELEYVRDILRNAEFMVKDFMLGQAHKVITPTLFDQLENQESGTERNGEDYSKLERKILFDSVSECLDFRCGLFYIGNCKSWASWATLFEKKGWLAEELYKEISAWRSMEDLMVDDLVDRDMSILYGRWLDFKTEAFEEGVEIEKGILVSLVDELVADLLI